MRIMEAVIITDWYNERYNKVNKNYVQFLSNEIRADGLKILFIIKMFDNSLTTAQLMFKILI